jgi:hypothetical protein
MMIMKVGILVKIAPHSATLTILVQTFQGDVSEQYNQLCNKLSHESPLVKILGVEFALGRFNMVVRVSSEKIESLLDALKRTQSLSFVQNTASFLTYSTEIIPDNVGTYRISDDAKTEILQYLGRMQTGLIRDVSDVKKQLEILLLLAQREVKEGSKQITSTEIRIVEKAFERKQEEERFRRRMRIISAVLGTALISLNFACGIFAVLGNLLLSTQTLVYMFGLAVIGGILILIAVAYEQVSAYLGAKVGRE